MVKWHLYNIYINATNVNTTLFRCHLTIVCLVGINYSIVFLFLYIYLRETHIQLMTSSNKMSKEIYYTVSNELNERDHEEYFW